MRYERIGETRSLSLTRENATITRRRTRRTRRIKKNEVKEKNERLRVRTTLRTVAHKENSYSPTGSCERTLIFNNRFSPKEEEEGPLVVAGADISLSLFPSKLSLYMWITWVLFLSRFVRLSLVSGKLRKSKRKLWGKSFLTFLFFFHRVKTTRTYTHRERERDKRSETCVSRYISLVKVCACECA